MKWITLLGSGILILGLCLLLACLTGCFADVGELKLVSVEVVSQEKIPSQDRWWDKGVITDHLMRVTFQSDTDMEAVARDFDYNISNDTSLCRGL